MPTTASGPNRENWKRSKPRADFFSLAGRLVVTLDYFRTIGGSSLTDPKIAVPDGDLNNSNIPNTYVPFRNAHFLSIAVSWA